MLSSATAREMTVLAVLGGLGSTMCARQFPDPAPELPDRILTPIDPSRRVVLPRTEHPLAGAQFDRGPVDGSTRVDGLTLTLMRSPEQEADLQRLLADLQDPASPRFRDWLTPEQFGARFGLSAHDIEATTEWLRSEGFEVTGVSNKKNSGS